MGERLINHLRVERAKRGWTQAELPALVGVSRKTIITVENEVFVPSTVEGLFELDEEAVAVERPNTGSVVGAARWCLESPVSGRAGEPVELPRAVDHEGPGEHPEYRVPATPEQQACSVAKGEKGDASLCIQATGADPGIAGEREGGTAQADRSGHDQQGTTGDQNRVPNRARVVIAGGDKTKGDKHGAHQQDGGQPHAACSCSAGTDEAVSFHLALPWLSSSDPAKAEARGALAQASVATAEWLLAWDARVRPVRAMQLSAGTGPALSHPQFLPTHPSVPYGVADLPFTRSEPRHARLYFQEYHLLEPARIQPIEDHQVNR